MNNEGPKYLKREIATFEQHRAELMAKAAGRYVLIHGSDVLGTFATEQDAVDTGYRQLGRVPFLVRHITAVDLPVEIYLPIQVA
jgi:hypothetical protein